MYRNPQANVRSGSRANKAGAEFSGPAIVEQIDSTVVVPPNTTATVDKYLNILIRVKG